AAPVDLVPRPNLRADSNLVLIPTAVNDPLNRPVAGLEKDNFRIFDDNIPQTISTFSTEDDPIAAGLIFDTSGSMSGLAPQERAVAREFFRTANPEDEFLLVEFDTAPRLVVPLTRDPGKINYQLLFSHTRGSTALLDGVVLGLHEIKKSAKPRKALVVV